MVGRSLDVVRLQVDNVLTSEGIDAAPRPEGVDLDGSRRNGDHPQPQATLDAHVRTVVKHLRGQLRRHVRRVNICGCGDRIASFPVSTPQLFSHMETGNEAMNCILV